MKNHSMQKDYDSAFETLVLFVAVVAVEALACSLAEVALIFSTTR